MTDGVPELADGEWAEPEYLDRLTASAERVTLGRGASETLTLRVHARPAR